MTAFIKENIADQSWASNCWGATTYAVVEATAGTPGTIEIAGPHAAELGSGVKFRIIGSTGNDAEYESTGAVYSSPNTVISVASLADGTDDGSVVLCPVWPGDTGSTEADTVEITTANPPTDGPAAPITIAAFHCAGNSFARTINLVIASGGSLLMGTLGGTDAPWWDGDASLAATADFYGSSLNTAYGFSLCNYATFHDSSCDDGSSPSNYATFYDSSSKWSGAGGEDITFNDDSTLNGAILGSCATFNHHSYVMNGLVGDGATFNSDGTFSGEYVGTYSVQAPLTFDANTPPRAPSAYFAEFRLMTTTASVMNPVAGMKVMLDTTDIESGNIAKDKTILGVPGTRKGGINGSSLLGMASY